MILALLSDLHSNLEAFEAALASLEKHPHDQLICLGDVVGYGANPQECLQLIRSRAQILLLGNHDAAVAGRESLTYFNDFARTAVRWTQTVISAEEKAILASLPLEAKVNDLHFVHATPKHPEAWNYIFSHYDVQEQFAAVAGKVCFIGHSHVPGDYREFQSAQGYLAPENPGCEGRRIINVGSVGQPRDRDPRLCYALFNTETEELQVIREEYDIDTAAGKIRRAGLPEFLADRLYWGW